MQVERIANDDDDDNVNDSFMIQKLNNNSESDADSTQLEVKDTSNLINMVKDNYYRFLK